MREGSDLKFVMRNGEVDKPRWQSRLAKITGWIVGAKTPKFEQCFFLSEPPFSS